MASNEIRRGAAEMTMAMLMSGTIGWLVVSSQQSAFNVVFFRCIFGGATLALVCAVLGLFRRQLFSWKMLGLALLGGAAIVANWVLLFAAYSRASISMATAVYNTQPFMLVALGALVFRERISASTVAWLLLAFVGLVFVVKVEPAVLAVPGQYLVGIGYAVGAAAMYAVSSIITKRLKGTPPHLIALIQVSLGVVMLAPLVRFDALPATGVQWLELIVLGVVNTGLMYVLLYGAIQKLPTSMTGALSFIYPVVAIIVDRIAFGQTLAWIQVLGAVLILLAAAGVNLGWRIVPQRRVPTV
ncbi:DMT family transporter [bacterium M00.F.Ca.ET.228.01.1.1]|uniref:DMT family transporter n=1 Tax=Paraburkholderia phenoliruptrix TaxID=252970 RepID=UPI001092C256|nr:DMT family transporter [Paraburkholderia phenoliruptrix]TGP44748.1 DMT family transporter [bacterium M00.F.Ca.ET.228.01.1.1]TGS02631.1 DMT family transporter [bacterium M00.F.Ca.ET.191.01.1.1]TGU06013.1 DMT family transporter [bacterium M00.F.Ca.ET.155.01.1.1]MBW0450260.1 DMT family transporter [Paraburkholderia phenoliruptrix]MBW9099949.1 DMT family transporter [Paraburkholderia phenoliruptrix]